MLIEAAERGIQPIFPLPASVLTTPSQDDVCLTTSSAFGDPNSVRVPSCASGLPPGERRIVVGCVTSATSAPSLRGAARLLVVGAREGVNAVVLVAPVPPIITAPIAIGTSGTAAQATASTARERESCEGRLCSPESST